MTRYSRADLGDWSLVGGSDRQVVGRALAAGPGDDRIPHDIAIGYQRDEGYTGDVWAEATVFRLPLSRGRLGALRHELRRWLALPLAEMGETSFTFAIELSSAKSSSFTLEFSPRSELITGAGETGCRTSVRINNFSAEVLFTINPTDLEGFVQGVGGVLQAGSCPAR